VHGMPERRGQRFTAQAWKLPEHQLDMDHSNAMGAPEERGARPAKLRPPGILELEDLLSNHLDTRVKVELGNKKGRVTIDFGSLEDLERIYRAMTEPPAG